MKCYCAGVKVLLIQTYSHKVNLIKQDKNGHEKGRVIILKCDVTVVFIEALLLH